MMPTMAAVIPSGRPAVDAAMAGVGDLDLGAELTMVDPLVPERATLALVHSDAYLDRLAATAPGGDGQLDADTYVTSDSWRTAQRAWELAW